MSLAFCLEPSLFGCTESPINYSIAPIDRYKFGILCTRSVRVPLFRVGGCKACPVWFTELDSLTKEDFLLKIMESTSDDEATCTVF